MGTALSRSLLNPHDSLHDPPMSGKGTDEVILPRVVRRYEFEGFGLSGKNKPGCGYDLGNVRDVAQLHCSWMVCQHLIRRSSYFLERARLANDDVMGHGIGIFKNQSDSFPGRGVEDFPVEKHLLSYGFKYYRDGLGSLFWVLALLVPFLSLNALLEHLCKLVALLCPLIEVPDEGRLGSSRSILAEV